MQHLESGAQLRSKEQHLIDELTRTGHVAPAERLGPLAASVWGYRRRARLGVKHVPKKGGVLVGFRESFSPLVAEIGECAVLPERVSGLLRPLAQLIGALSIRARVPQIEVAVADNVLALVLRVLDPPTASDRDLLQSFARAQTLEFYLQPGGLESVVPLTEPATPLYYELPEHDVRITFAPTDFIQVNGPVNEQLIARAIEQLAPRPEDRVLDLFCGLGNFTLPLARRVASVTGVEGDMGLVEACATQRSKPTASGMPTSTWQTLARSCPTTSGHADPTTWSSSIRPGSAPKRWLPGLAGGVHSASSMFPATPPASPGTPVFS